MQFINKNKIEKSLGTPQAFAFLINIRWVINQLLIIRYTLVSNDVLIGEITKLLFYVKNLLFALLSVLVKFSCCS